MDNDVKMQMVQQLRRACGTSRTIALLELLGTCSGLELKFLAMRLDDVLARHPTSKQVKSSTKKKKKKKKKKKRGRRRGRRRGEEEEEEGKKKKKRCFSLSGCLVVFILNLPLSLINKSNIVS